MEKIRQSGAIPTLVELGAKPSISEERGLALLQPSDKVIFSPGISTAGFAEIRMAQQNPERRVIATTIDAGGMQYTSDLVRRVGLQSQIETKLEDLRGPWNHAPDSFDFIYARLVLHYISTQDLDSTLQNFMRSLRPGGRLFAVVQSVKNIDPNDPNNKYDPETRLTSRVKYLTDGTIIGIGERYLQTPESFGEHVERAGFVLQSVQEYEEQLYHDYERTHEMIGPRPSQLIEIVAVKPAKA